MADQVEWVVEIEGHGGVFMPEYQAATPEEAINKATEFVKRYHPALAPFTVVRYGKITTPEGQSRGTVWWILATAKKPVKKDKE